MPEANLVGLFVAALNRLDIPYVVTGGLASTIYGEPRFTRDVDIVLQIPRSKIDEFTAVWPSSQYYVPPQETVMEEVARADHGHFNVIHHDTGLRADIYLAGTNDFSNWALANPYVVDVQGEVVRFAPIEYVILNKLLYFRIGGSDRHLRDVANMFRIRADLVNEGTLDEWAKTLGLTKETERARRYREPLG